jgi:hypothetical protein
MATLRGLGSTAAEGTIPLGDPPPRSMRRNREARSPSAVGSPFSISSAFHDSFLRLR